MQYAIGLSRLDELHPTLLNGNVQELGRAAARHVGVDLLGLLHQTEPRGPIGAGADAGVLDQDDDLLARLRAGPTAPGSGARLLGGAGLGLSGRRPALGRSLGSARGLLRRSGVRAVGHPR